MSRFTETQIRRVFLAALNDEGHTEYWGDPDHAGRYIVAGVQTIRSTRAELSLSAIRRMVLDYGCLAETLGVWSDNGAVYVDLGDTYYTESAAIQTAQRRGELAIWDRVESREIRAL